MQSLDRAVRAPSLGRPGIDSRVNDEPPPDEADRTFTVTIRKQ